MHTIKKHTKVGIDKMHVLENVEHCRGEPEQAANMHMNRPSFTLK